MKLRLAGAALFACSMFAAQEAQDPHKHAGKEVTVTGCLLTGPSASMYVFTEEGTGKRMTVSGGDTDLSKHANHKVKITGATDTEKENHVTVTKVEHISDTCSAN